MTIESIAARCALCAAFGWSLLFLAVLVLRVRGGM
jgi:hypothetical protein